MSSKSSRRLNRTRSSPLSNNVSSRKNEPSDDSDPDDSHLKCDSAVDGHSNNNSLLEDSSSVVSNGFKKRKGEKLKDDDMHLSKKVIKENDIDDLSENQDSTGSDSMTGATHSDLAEVKNDLEAGIKQKEEILRKLNMVKMYREKHDLEELDRLTEKWLNVNQESLVRLREIAADPKPSLTDIIRICQLENDVVRYDPDEESFY